MTNFFVKTKDWSKSLVMPGNTDSVLPALFPSWVIHDQSLHWGHMISVFWVSSTGSVVPKIRFSFHGLPLPSCCLVRIRSGGEILKEEGGGKGGMNTMWTMSDGTLV